MQFQSLIEGREKELKRLLQKHQVKSLYIFGSAINEAADKAANDIDLIVEIDEADPLTKGELLIALWDKLESFFGKKVDLLTESSIRNPILKSKIESSKIKVYDGGTEKIII